MLGDKRGFQAARSAGSKGTSAVVLYDPINRRQQISTTMGKGESVNAILDHVPVWITC